ncbi:hypothetical protein [Oricola thermophila]|uniref:Uncharacterized protein n=1 Tax=Oricola thermophila TaxID=2742145 RepID=A0A6N1VCY6_9HYPH|nr:hypothetical protein [Oricola thermophila]QKV16989.1 hypothetical protein HTY61_00165 [Oricola thermophila]
MKQTNPDSVGWTRASAALRHVLVAGVVAAAIPSAGTAKAASGRLLENMPMVRASLTDLLVSVPYADAMADCASRILDTRVIGCELVPSTLAMRHSFWIWQSEDGSTVSRMRAGGYRIRSGNCLGSFCTWETCRVTEWPRLSCSDGRTLTASVPESSRFVLSGNSYGRVRSLR